LRNNRGASLAELMIALGVLAVGILGVFQVFADGVRGEAQADRVTSAIMYDRQLITLIRTRNLAFGGIASDASTDRRALNEAPFANDLPADSGFTRNIQLQQFEPSGYPSSLRRIIVTVYWSDRGTERKVELQTVQRQI